VIRDGRVLAILDGDALTEDGIARQLVVSRVVETSAETVGVAAEPLSSQSTTGHTARFSPTPGPRKSLPSSEWRALARPSCLRSFAGLESCSGAIKIAGEKGPATQRLCPRDPDTEPLQQLRPRRESPRPPSILDTQRCGCLVARASARWRLLGHFRCAP
jgi:hypothetical protein